MADTIAYRHSETGVVLYAQFFNADDEVWNGSAMESYDTANIGTYDVAMTEQGTASRRYAVAVPALPAGLYRVEVLKRAGGSPAESDQSVASGAGEWDGTRWTRLGAPAGVSIAADLLTIDNLVDDLEGRLTSTRAGYLDNLSAGAVALQASVDTLEASAAAIEAYTQDIQSRLPAALVGGRIDATVDATGMESGAIDAILDDTIGDGTLTVRQVLRVLVAGMAGKLSGAATTTVTIRNAADSANVIVATVDSDGNRSAVTVTP